MFICLDAVTRAIPCRITAYCLLLLYQYDMPCKFALTTSERLHATKHVENICMWMVKMDLFH